MATRLANTLAHSFTQFTITLLVLLSVQSTGLAADFLPGEFEDIESIANEIMSKYPPDRYCYIGAGRSPTPLIAYFQVILPPGSAYNLPYSKTKARINAEPSLSSRTQRLTTDELTRLDQHFIKHLPTEEIIGKRKVLLIDFVITGEGLLSAYDYVDHFFRTHNRPHQVELASMIYPAGTGLTVEAQAELLSRGTNIHLNSRPVILRRLLRSGYDGTAEYDLHDPRHPDLPPSVLSKQRFQRYQQFKEAIRKRVEPPTSLINRCMRYLIKSIIK